MINQEDFLILQVLTFCPKNPSGWTLINIIHLNLKVMINCEVITSMKCEKQGFWCLCLFITTERDGKRRGKVYVRKQEISFILSTPPSFPSMFFSSFCDLYHFDISKKNFYAHINICVKFPLVIVWVGVWSELKKELLKLTNT